MILLSGAFLLAFVTTLPVAALDIAGALEPAAPRRPQNPPKPYPYRDEVFTYESPER